MTTKEPSKATASNPGEAKLRWMMPATCVRLASCDSFCGVGRVKSQPFGGAPTVELYKVVSSQ